MTFSNIRDKKNYLLGNILINMVCFYKILVTVNIHNPFPQDFKAMGGGQIKRVITNCGHNMKKYRVI